MNVLFVTDDDLIKSVVYDIHVLSEGLSLLGHNVFVVDCKRDKPNWFRTIKQEMARVYPNANVHMFRYTMLTFPIFTEKFHSFVWKFLYAYSNCYKLASKVVKKNDIDVIVIYSVINSGLSMIQLGKKFNIPVVFRNIDMLHRLNANTMVRSAVAFFELMVYPRVDKLLALTPKYADYLITMGGQHSDIEILPFPVDISPWEANPPLDKDFPEICQKWQKENRQVIVFIGHLYPFSGLGEFFRTFSKIIEQIPKARLLIVGDGPMRAELEAVISQLKLLEYVFITGLQPFKMLPSYINMASVCINPYPVTGDMKDLFAAKVIQYLACKKPTVSSALPGMQTMIPGESCGVVYVNNAEDMAKEVILLLQDPKKRKLLGQAGLDYVRQVHSRDKVVAQFEKQLMECLGNKPRKKLRENFIYRFLKNKRTKWYENRLYNSANMGYTYYRAGQRINRISSGFIISQVKLYMDKIGNPKGIGSCVIRSVVDDSIVGIMGTIEISTLPLSPMDPQWVLFSANATKILNKGDFRVVFEWNTEDGDSANYPRVRYNNSDKIYGVFTQYNYEEKWIDRSDSDASIIICIE